MKFACDSCQTKYTIPDEKVRGKVLKIRCKKCNAVITVKEEAPPPEPELEQPPVEERTRVADIGLLEKLRASEGASTAAAMPAAKAPAPAAPSAPAYEWYAMINGAQEGPLNHDTFLAKVQEGAITDRTHVWRDGLGNWARAGELDDLKEFFAKAEEPPPPPPPPAATAPAADLSGFAGGGDEQPTALAASPALSNPDLFNDADPGPGTGPAEAGEEFGANGAMHEGNGVAQPGSNLADLVASDLDAHAEQHNDGAQPVEMGQAPADPFASVPDAPGVKAPVIGEQTRFFMKKAGVTNRNPWWKYAIFVACVLGLPTATIYALGKMGVGGTTYVIDSTGEVKEVAAFGFEGIAAKTGLGALLLGQQKANEETVKKAIAAKQPRPKHPKEANKNPSPNPGDAPDRPKATANLTKEEQERLQMGTGLIGADDPTGKGTPQVRPKEEKKPATDVGSEGLSAEVINKVIADNSSGFNKCVEEELRHNPSWKGGKVVVSIKIKSSGTVIEPSIDKPAVNNSSVGECIKTKAKRIVFPRFEGDEQPVEFPLILTNGG